MSNGFRRPIFSTANAEARRWGSFCPVSGGKREKFVPNYSTGLEARAPGGRTLQAAGKKNRASWSEGDQKARGIFEFSTPVGLGDFRLLLYYTYSRNYHGQSKNNSKPDLP
jgi:hypothetical protein